MEIFFRITLFLAGLINLLPSILAFFPDKISKSYGIEIPNENYELLLRHRAVLFAIIGGLMIVSSLTKKYYEVAIIVGLISMLSFVSLFFIINKDINSELRKVMTIDMIAIVILLIGSLLFWIKSKT
jgi:hypothetical protein